MKKRGVWQQDMFRESLRGLQQEASERVGKSPMKDKPSGKDAWRKGSCMSCVHAQLARWDDNPVIAQCVLKDMKQVAMRYRCKMYKCDTNEKEIEKRTHYEQNR